MKHLLLTFYGDDFTGSTDALEQLSLAGIRTALFVDPPAPGQLKRYRGLQALGVAGRTRSLAPAAMTRELRPALKKLKSLGAPHVHYKVCSTFDSSPATGSIGRAIDIAAEIFPAPFVPLLVAAPALGRYCVFGNLFARFGIGSAGAVYRLDRHPSASRHPVTPMTEADLRRHLARQTKKSIGLFDILKLELPLKEARVALKKIVAGGARIVLFDALDAGQLRFVGELIDEHSSGRRPLFSVGSSGIEAALGAHWSGRSGGRRRKHPSARKRPGRTAGPLLVGSGSCSPVTTGQIAWALKHGLAAVTLNASTVMSARTKEIRRATDTAIKFLKTGRSVIVHTGKRRSGLRNSAQLLGSALGAVLRGALERVSVGRLCVAGGDTSSYAARALGIEALEMIAPLTPGAPLCRAHAPGSPVDGCEVVFKGGQVGAEDYFGTV